MQTRNSSTQPLTAKAIRTWLVTQVSQELGVNADEIDIQAPLDSYGLNSAQALGLLNKTEQMLGFQVSPVLLWHYPTIETLSERLAEESQDEDADVFEF